LVWQDLESEKIKNHLTILAKRFNKAISMIQPPTRDRPSRQSQPFSELEVVVEKEHKKLLARKVLIERRKEEQERQMLEMVGGKSFPCHPMWFQCFLFR
jgi:translation initiation factor 3 subunit A